MRTKLTHYCEQFDRTIRPLLAPLDLAQKALTEASDDTPGATLAAPLRDLRHHLAVLCDKVKDQQAYVLIFGPLKSGKSTLMNAIAAAYVSEVSSLPAYPCLVFVGPGARREFLVTYYDGRTQTFGDSQALARFITAAHGDLAAAIRKAEQSQLEFDPQEHFPQAIRRVDVLLPDTALESTGAVLVDTPGLYTRMRFGYDRMTRDFRDAAACAVFVVRSDTLFLEQVFAEFHQLLDLFSRIFLVVNIDSNKRDIGPDGRIVPSLEQSRPEAILEAFQQLAMSAPLHRAASEGRVRMYPVDLLQAAASVLQPTGSAAADEAPPRGFARFRDDLTEFLASDEYLDSFRRDSLQRARTLLDDLMGLLENESTQELIRRRAEVNAAAEEAQAECDLVERALAIDLDAAFARCDQAVRGEIERCARDEGAKLLRTLGASIDTWFLSGHSLEWLIGDHWRPLLTDYRREVARAARRALDPLGQQHDAGLDLPAAVADLCTRRGVDLLEVRRTALAAIGEVRPRPDLRVPVSVAAIPIKKSLLDRLSFRSVDKLRERLFGDLGRPDQKITARDKAARLGEPGRLHLHQCVVQFRGDLPRQTGGDVDDHYTTALRAATVADLHRRLRQLLPPQRATVARMTGERDRLDLLLQPLRALDSATRSLLPQLPALLQAAGASRAPAAEPTALLTPQPPRKAQPADAGKPAQKGTGPHR